MQSHTLTLTEKNQLTHDVWELVYSHDDSIWDGPGQFLLCDCDHKDPKKKRSYSISWAHAGRYEFIIKREEHGTGGSVAICDQKVGHKMQVMGPLGHFTLRTTDTPKLFIGTGTGFAPLHYQIRSCLTSCPGCPVHFIFGVRHEHDLFYLDRLDDWSANNDHFSHKLCVSQPTGAVAGHHVGYVTDLLTQQYIDELGFGVDELEVYLCGSPAMVRDARQKIGTLGIPNESIFYEQY